MKIYEDKYYDICIECRSKDGTRKQSYPSMKEALEVIDRSPPMERKKLDCYPCPYGNGWHLTSKY